MTQAHDTAKTVKILKELVHLDYDAIEAYEAAIDRLENPEYSRQLAIYCEDHRRHTDNIGRHLREMGEEPPSGPDLKRVLTEGKVVLGGLVGDKAILMAMRANEAVTNKTYEEAVKHAGHTAGLTETLSANLADERRHRDSLERAIDDA